MSDGEYKHRVGNLRKQQGCDRGNQQDIDERAQELAEENVYRARHRRFGQAIRPILREPPRRLVRTQARQFCRWPGNTELCNIVRHTSSAVIPVAGRLLSVTGMPEDRWDNTYASVYPPAWILIQCIKKSALRINAAPIIIVPSIFRGA
jgi:hypothetical protein